MLSVGIGFHGAGEFRVEENFLVPLPYLVVVTRVYLHYLAVVQPRVYVLVLILHNAFRSVQVEPGNIKHNSNNYKKLLKLSSIVFGKTVAFLYSIYCKCFCYHSPQCIQDRRNQIY